MKKKLKDLLFVLWCSLHRYGAKEYIIPNDARLTCCCLSVIDKSWDHRYLNVKLGCFFSYQDNCLIRICWLESHENKSEGLGYSWITAAHFLLCLFWDATDHTLIPLCCLCKSHVAGLISILLLRLWLDMKLSCCLHQLWLIGLSGLCSDV